MATFKVNLITRPNANVNPAESGSELSNCYIDESMALILRPGSTSIETISTSGIDGIYYWNSKGWCIIVAGGRVYKKTSASAAATEVTSSALLQSGTLVSFATNGVWLYMANGGQIVRWDGTNPPELDDEPYAPNPCTHLIFLDGYILGNLQNTSRFYYAEPDPGDANAHLIWQATGLNAEGSPDIVNALAVGWREALVFGTESAELWWNDGETPFIRQDGAYIETGAIAPYTVKKYGNTFIWLSHEKKVVRLEERTPVSVSATLDQILQSYETIADAFADVFIEGGRQFYVLTFPTHGVTFALDLSNGDWARWSYWDSTAQDHLVFPAVCGTYIPAWKVNYYGKSNGSLWKLDSTVYQDGSNPIFFQYRSEHVTAGTYSRKRSNRVTLALKRGYDYARFGVSPDDPEPHYPGFAAPTISDTSIPVGAEGVYYSHTFSVTAGTGNAPFTWTMLSAPAGMTLSSAGVFSGTPPAGGTQSVGVRVTDSEGQRDDAYITWEVAEVETGIATYLSAYRLIGEAGLLVDGTWTLSAESLTYTTPAYVSFGDGGHAADGSALPVDRSRTALVNEIVRRSCANSFDTATGIATAYVQLGQSEYSGTQFSEYGLHKSDGTLFAILNLGVVTKGSTYFQARVQIYV